MQVKRINVSTKKNYKNNPDLKPSEEIGICGKITPDNINDQSCGELLVE